jgi:nitrate/nitrite transporter NarK
MFGNMENKKLIYFSWFITVSAIIFIYGGFHPDRVAKGRILGFSMYLVMFAHLPAILSLIGNFSKIRENLRYILFVVASILIQYFILSKK